MALTGSMAVLGGPAAQAADGYATPNAIPGFDASVLYRLAGSNRYTTAIAASGFGFPEGNSANAVVLARGDSFADALPGGALATAVEGPLLLTTPTALPTETLAEIVRVLTEGSTVYLLGGTGAISDDVAAALVTAGFKTVRIAGADRYATSVKIAQRIETELGAAAEHVFVATGLNFPDGLAAAGAAAQHNYPGSTSPGVVVLSAGSTLPASVQEYVDVAYGQSLSSELIPVGGPAVTAVGASYPCNEADAIYCITGASRYETAVNLARFDFPPAFMTGFGIATGANFPDALAGSAILGRYGYPLLLVAPTGVPAGVGDYLGEMDTAQDVLVGLTFGGTGAVPADTATGVCGAAGVPAEFCDIAY